MKKKILMVTPKFPYPPYGACEQDRAAGIEMLIKTGHNVYLITKVYGDEYKQIADEMAKKLGITIIPISYKFLGRKNILQKIKDFIWRLARPWRWDGAVLEYAEPEIQKAVKEALKNFKPDIVWFDYTYLWPLYKFVKEAKIPIITRSINFEPNHFLDEDGRKILNYLKFLLKLLSEFIVCWKSDVILAVTPHEAEIYKKFGAKKVDVLPLRGLPLCLEWRYGAKEKKILNVFFAGSTYNVSHNLAALELIIKELAPRARKLWPGEFKFHILGRKFPEALRGHLNDYIIYHDYLTRDEYLIFLSEMDIALSPSLYGAGMQQKIFEPVARGFPTITSARGLAGYKFINDEEILLAENIEEYIECLGRFRSFDFRRKISKAAETKSAELFSLKKIEKVISDSLIL